MAPKGTPKDRLDIVARALAKAQGDAGFRKAIEAQGFQISEIPAQTLPKFILDQQAFWRDKVKALNITAGK
jgi:tripartite-type tricarboxylate transporter receptor subunit TctC